VISAPDHIDQIFWEALQLASDDERKAYLERACGTNHELRELVEKLLRAEPKAAAFLEQPVPEAQGTVDGPVTEGPGSVIGRYKLLEQIGEGGFGIVFMAEHMQPVRRKVALKVLKPGMDTRQVVARFEAERQALAIMDHPNIAKVHDGGMTGEPGCVSAGRPYFVMELVKGVRITDFCDQNQLTPRQRLELFLPVCQAMQHAHQKGIIHRDLKPSNVLVPVHDTTPVVKVIDFGVAKALGQELTDKTLFTAFAQMIGTPLYMSPEQAGQSGLDIDTRSDIYSLGVLLYELLTGTTPFERERFKKAGYDEIRRIIREEEPPRPSTRISTLGQAAITISTQRKSDPRRLSQLCRGELDWIVMKALEKDRNRRYETASAFAADVEHYLHDEPVQACPPSGWYRFRKFARRNKPGLVTAGIVALALVVGTAIATWQAIRATQAEGLADTRLETLTGEHKRTIVAERDAKEAAERLRLEKREAQIKLATSYLDKGLDFCEQGEVGLGMLWVGRSLENAPEDATDLQRVIRTNLAGWRHTMCPLKAVIPFEAGVCRVAFRPDGRSFLTVSGIPNPTGCRAEVRCWDATTTASLGSSIPHQGFNAAAVAISPDGNTVVTGKGWNTAQLWDVDTAQPRGSPLAHPEILIHDVIFSADSRTVLTQADKKVRLWDTATGKPLGKPLEHDLYARAALSPDGRIVLTASGMTARLWKAATGEPFGPALPHPDWTVPSGNRAGIAAAAFSPDGRFLVTAGAKRVQSEVQLWEVATGKPLGKPLSGPTVPAGIVRVVFSPDGNLVSMLVPYEIWNVNVGSTGLERIPEVEAFSWRHGGIHTAAFSPDGQTILTGGGKGVDYTAQLWTRTMQPIGLPLRHPSQVTAVAISPDGRTLLTGSNGPTTAVTVWDVHKHKPVDVLTYGEPAQNTIALSPDGKTLLHGVTYGQPNRTVVDLWDVATRQRIQPPLDLDGHISEPVFSPDGRSALLKNAISTPDNKNVQTLWLWQRGTWQRTEPPGGLPPPQEAILEELAFGPGGPTVLLVTLTTPGTPESPWTAQLWDVTTWRPLGKPFKVHPNSFRTVATSPDGKVALATAANAQEARLRDTASGAFLGSPLIHQGRVHPAGTFSPDGRTVVTSGSDKTVRLWDVATQKQIRVLHPGDGVAAVTFSPNGRTILTTSFGGGSRFWDTATGKPLGPPLPSAAGKQLFSPDGQTVILANHADMSRWELPAPLKGDVARLVLWTQLIAGRDLDAANVAGWLTPTTWNERCQQLKKLGGLPVPPVDGVASERRQAEACHHLKRGKFYSRAWVIAYAMAGEWEKLKEEVAARDQKTTLIKGELTAQVNAVHQVTMVAGNLYVIDMESQKESDPILRLEDAGKKVIEERHAKVGPVRWRDGNPNLQIIFEAMKDGPYRIVAAAAASSRRPGTYTITVREFVRN
jgi:WD40 repeat protein/serine/threonine protein kinase